VRIPVSGLAFDRPVPTPETPPPELVHPSAVHLEGERIEVGRAIVIGHRIDLQVPDTDMERVGTALHAVLASPGRSTLLSSGVEAIAPAAVDAVVAAFERWVATLHPVEVMREWPVRWRIPSALGPRLLVGEIDVVLDLGDSLAIVDHKAFPGDAATRDARVREHAGQLAAYAAAIESAFGRRVSGTFIHFPLRGEVVEAHVPPGAFQRWLDGVGAVAPPLLPHEEDAAVAAPAEFAPVLPEEARPPPTVPLEPAFVAEPVLPGVPEAAPAVRAEPPELPERSARRRRRPAPEGQLDLFGPKA
jgi:hypothetical protein